MNNHKKIICYFLLVTSFFLFSLQSVQAGDPVGPVAGPDYAVMAGEWQRTDGGYLIKVSNLQTDGRVSVEYFNPKPIHVEHSAISTQKDLLKLFVQLEDKGYEGSTYTLYYYAEKDALAGFYYQAPTDKTYEVIFMRKSGAGI